MSYIECLIYYKLLSIELSLLSYYNAKSSKRVIYYD